jgi:hypothetical protein
MIHLSVVCGGQAVPCCGECYNTVAQQWHFATTKGYDDQGKRILLR